MRPSGSSATIVPESNERLPSTLKRSDVLRDERSAQAEVEAAELLGRLRARKRVARVQPSLRSPKLALPLHSRDVRPRDDLDLRPARVVVVGRERVGAEADLADLVARRQPAAAEAVHLEHRAGAAGHRLELRAAARRDRRAAPRSRPPRASSSASCRAVVGGRVADDDFFLEAGDAERDRLVRCCRGAASPSRRRA